MADVNFDQIMENPSIEAIQEMLGDPVVEEPNEESVKVDGEPDSAEVKADEKVVEKDEEEKDQDEEPAGIATKSGKGIIPYTELATERERRRAAEQTAAQMQQRLAEMERQLAAGVSKATAEQVDQSEEDIDEMLEDYPSLAKPIKALQAKLAQTEARLNQIHQIENRRAVEEQSNAEKSVQEAMDENPKLLYWQKDEPDLFDAAVAVDNQLKADPKFSQMSLTDRFAKAVAAVEAIYGATELPSEYGAKEEKVSDKELVERAAKAAAKAKDSGRPRTLSDLPGGVAPQSDDSKLENMTQSELFEMMSKKSPDEIAALVSRFG